MDREWDNWHKEDANLTKGVLVSNVNRKSGVYVFVVKEKFVINNNFFEEVTGTFKCGDVIIGVPAYNGDLSNGVTLKKEDVFYVGSANDLRTRLVSHLFHNKVNCTVSLKLGFKTREWVKDKLDIYWKELSIKKARDKEKEIRDNHKIIMGK